MSIVDAELTTLALCWRLERRDGVALGFTGHDRLLTIDELVYRSAPGMLPSAISRSDGFDPASLEVEGALTGDGISGADLAAGRWDGAAVTMFMVDWRAPDGEQVALARGTLGDIGSSGPAFTAEIKGATAALDRPVVEQTSPECRAELGDRRCRVDMAARVMLTRVVAVEDEDRLVLADGESVADAFGYGRLRWLSGANSGLERAVLRSDGATIHLREPPPFAAAVGDLVEVREGCDRLFATCRARFANAANFRGEPHLPGTDLLTRYGTN